MKLNTQTNKSNTKHKTNIKHNRNTKAQQEQTKQQNVHKQKMEIAAERNKPIQLNIQTDLPPEIKPQIRRDRTIESTFGTLDKPTWPEKEIE